MKMNYISRIRVNLKRYRTIHTDKASDRILDGTYASVYKGRGMNFDDLREYVSGDDIKDVDWKASARSQKLLVRQYIVEKKHNILLIPDTNYRMLADTALLEEKRDVALMSLGTLGFLVASNGDYVGSIYPTEKSMEYSPFKAGLMPLEQILNSYHHAVTPGNKANLNKTLDYVTKKINRPMIVVIATDIKGICDLDETILKRIRAAHDVLVFIVGDTDISGKRVYDIEKRAYLPAFFTRDKKLAALEKAKKERLALEGENKLKKYGVASVTVNGAGNIESSLIELLEKHKMQARGN